MEVTWNRSRPIGRPLVEGLRPVRQPEPRPCRHASDHRTVVITPRLVTWLIGGLIAAALAGGATFLALVPGSGGVVIDAGFESTAVAGAQVTTGLTAASSDGLGCSAAAPVDLVVDVEGAVAHPGLVHLPIGRTRG